MATKGKDKEKGEKSGLVSFWVNVFVLGIVMVVLGFYLGTYMLDVWRSGDDTAPNLVATTDLDDKAASGPVTGTSSQQTGSAQVSAPTTTGSAQVVTPTTSGSTQAAAPTTAGSATQSARSSTPAASGGLYKVQVGAFDDRAAAEALAGQLKREGYPDAWVTSTAPHRVQVGAYSNPDNATSVVKKLESSGYSVFIVN